MYYIIVKDDRTHRVLSADSIRVAEDTAIHEEETNDYVTSIILINEYEVLATFDRAGPTEEGVWWWSYKV